MTRTLRTMYNHIVIPIDGSDEAKQAVRRGLKLAQVFDATVDVLHVVEQRALRLMKTADEKKQLRERGERVLAEIREIASEVGYPITTELLEGKPVIKISEYAGEQDADLIVIGRQGMTRPGKRLLGGVTEQILHRSDIPVFVVPDGDLIPEREAEYARILILTDGSENAEVAIPHGVAIAQNYRAVVHVLNVVDLQAAGGVFSAGGLETEFVERLESRGQKAVNRVTAKIDETATDLDVNSAVERTTSFSGVAAGVREYVQKNEIDLIVMGSHGRSNLKRQLIGSIASALIHTVDVPVLVVKRST